MITISFSMQGKGKKKMPKDQGGKGRKQAKRPKPDVSSSSDSSSEDETPIVTSQTGIPPVPRTGHVSNKLKRAIKKGKYINLALLKVPTKEDREKPSRLVLDDTGALTTEKRNAELRFYDWLDCFWIFQSIRIEHHPGEVQGLIKHMMNVKTLHCRGKGAVEFDIQFRLAKAQHPQLQWGELHLDLVIDLPERELRSKPMPHREAGRSRSNKPYVPLKGQPTICYTYNRQMQCRSTPCRFSHQCAKCRGQHPAVACRAQPQQTRRI
jgi:hypothetical protein